MHSTLLLQDLCVIHKNHSTNHLQNQLTKVFNCLGVNVFVELEINI